MWKFLSENAEALSAIIAASVAIGSLITFIIGKFVAKKNKKSEKVSLLNSVIEEKDKEITELKQQLEKFTCVEKSIKGNFFILKEKNSEICPVCWNNNKKPIPIFGDKEGRYKCNVCGLDEIYDVHLNNETQARRRQFEKEIWDLNRNDNTPVDLNNYL